MWPDKNTSSICRHFKSMMLTVIAAGTMIPAAAQGTLEDYNRAYAARRNFGSQNVYYANVNPTWLNSGKAFWYVRETPQGRVYALVDAKSCKRTQLFDHKRLASSLSSQVGTQLNPDSLYLEHLRVSDKADTLFFNLKGSMYAYDVKRNSLCRTGQVPAPRKYPHWMEVNDEKDAAPAVSPDGTKEAFIRESNVWVRDLSTGKATQLSIDGAPGYYYSSWIYWSPDSKKVAVNKIRPAEKRFVYYVESSPSDQLQPKLHKQEYAKPGDELRFKLPCVFDVETGAAAIPDTRLFDKQYELYGPVWNSDSKAITFEYNERGHKVYRVLEMSAADASVRPLVEETHDKYVNYPRIYRHMLADAKRMIWSSERDNYNHLYMYDRATAKPINQITKGEWYVRGVQHVDELNDKIYFSANGVNDDEDPYNIHYYSINFDGSGLTDLTPAKGFHVATYSPDMQYVVDVVSSPTEAPVTTLRSAVTGNELMALEKADISKILERGWRAPEVFAAPGRDGKTMMWGLIQRPTNFDPNKKYPVIEYIYQGPGDQYVPKQFMSSNYWLQPISELGFIVVMVDGMSTSFRSREFENICYKNLSDAALPDHMAWLKAAGAKYPELDLDCIGIYGCSAGGQESTNALLLYPDFYKAAYSACGCHDNRMDKIWWNELWMGYPVDESYKRCSNVENAHLLRRPLMLVVGEIDDNVDPASTMQVVNALQKANKDFELVVIPGAHHTMGEAFGDHKRYDFFVKHLMGVTPPDWSEIKY